MFDKKLILSDTEFTYLPSFNNITLPDTIDFRRAVFHTINIEEANLKIDLRTSIKKNNSVKKCKLFLKGTDASKFILPYSNFELEFNVVDLFDEESLFDDKASIYEAIIKTSREAGMTESTKNWDIDYRKLQLNHDWPIFGKYIIVFNDKWWNFGYEKWRILVLWLPFFFLCFLIWNFFRINTLWENMYKDVELGEKFRKKGEHAGPIKDFGWQRFSFTFFYTAVIYFGFKIRHEAVNYKNTRGLLYLYLMYAVGTLHMAFALSYILSAY